MPKKINLQTELTCKTMWGAVLWLWLFQVCFSPTHEHHFKAGIFNYIDQGATFPFMLCYVQSLLSQPYLPIGWGGLT